MFGRRSDEQASDALQPAGTWSAVVAYVAATVTVVLGVAGGLVLPLLDGALALPHG